MGDGLIQRCRRRSFARRGRCPAQRGEGGCFIGAETVPPHGAELVAREPPRLAFARSGAEPAFRFRLVDPLVGGRLVNDGGAPREFLEHGRGHAGDFPAATSVRDAVAEHAQLAGKACVEGLFKIRRAFNERSGRRFGQPNATSTPLGWNWYLPFGLDTPAKIYSLTFQRYMHRYGLTNADFGFYPVVARRHAATNPDAWFFGRPITLEEHQESRWIVEPILRLLDCCQESDGGVALVVTRADRAADLPKPGVAIAAASDGHVGGGDVMFNYYHGDLAEFPESIALGKRLYAQAGGGPSDIDAAMIYENFSPVVFLQLEALGFCGPGEARDFIAEGNIDLDGALPVNPHGGLLGEAYIHGMNNIVEGVRQIRGTAANQLADPQRVMVVGGRSGLILEPV